VLRHSLSEAKYNKVRSKIRITISPSQLEEFELAYDKGLITEKQISMYRLLFDPTTIDPIDYKNLGINPWDEWLSKYQMKTDDFSQTLQRGFDAAFLLEKIVERLKPVPETAIKHSNIDLRSCFLALKPVVAKEQMEMVLSILLHANNLTEASATCFLIAMTSVKTSTEIINFLARTQVLSIESESEMVEALGEAHNIVKLTQTWFDGRYLSDEEACMLQYIKELVSRRDFEGDIWKDDIYQRLREGPVKRVFRYDPSRNYLIGNSKMFTTMLHEEVDEIITSIMNKWLNSLKTFQEFWDERHTWVASGAAPRFKVEIPERIYNKDIGEMEYTGKVNKYRLNKRAAFEQVKFEEVTEELKGKPYIYSTGAAKRENGKLRALYNTQLSHYIAQSYILEQVEPLLSGVAGYDLNDVDNVAVDNLRKRYEMAERKANFWMWDYVDFNVQHENDDMCYIWDSIAKHIDKVKMMNVHDEDAQQDIVSISKWVSEAEKNCYISSPSGEFDGMKIRGLLTGSRGTQFINTILNIVYLRILRRQFTILFKDDPIVMAWNHGDDVFSEAKKKSYAKMLSHVARMMGLAGNLGKISRQFGEYLRIHYSDGFVGGHVLRSIANLVTRDWQSSVDFYPEEKVRALTIQFRKALARGGLMRQLDAIFKSELNFYSTVKTKVKILNHRNEVKTVEREIRVPREWFFGSVLDNASGAGGLRESASRLTTTLPKLTSRIHINRYIRGYYGSQMTDDYWRKIHKMFPMMGKLDRDTLAEVKHTFQADNIMGSLPGYVNKSNKFKYISNLKHFLKKFVTPFYVSDEIDNEARDAIMTGFRDFHFIQKNWIKLEIDVWRFGLNAFTMAERALAKMPSKRKDVLMLWVKALAGEVNIDILEAMIQVIAITGNDKIMLSDIISLEDLFDRKILLKVLLGLVPFDGILDGYLSSEVVQLIRNTAIYRAIAYARGRGIIIKDKKFMQKYVRMYEMAVKECIPKYMVNGYKLLP